MQPGQTLVKTWQKTHRIKSSAKRTLGQAPKLSNVDFPPAKNGGDRSPHHVTPQTPLVDRFLGVLTPSPLPIPQIQNTHTYPFIIVQPPPPHLHRVWGSLQAVCLCS